MKLFVLAIVVITFFVSGSAVAQMRDHGGHSGHQHGTTAPDGSQLNRQLNTERTQMSAQGHYKVSIAPQAEPVSINAMHSWVLEVLSASGSPVTNAVIAVRGGMPQHGHGLPTAPRVTQHIGDGKYLVEGMRFNMAGWWALRFEFDAPMADTVGFNLVIE